MKASLHGPNRRRNRPGDLTVASDLSQSRGGVSTSASRASQQLRNKKAGFRIRSIDELLDSSSPVVQKVTSGLGNGCLFTINGDAGKELLRSHKELTGDSSSIGEPILVHFHDIPILILRAVPLPLAAGGKEEEENDVLYLSRVHQHNHKVCEDTTMQVTCCSRPSASNDYDLLSAVGMDVYLRRTFKTADANECSDDDSDSKASFDAKDICRQLLNQTCHSVLTVNESAVISVAHTDLVCRVAEVRVDKADVVASPSSAMSSADAAMSEPYRGRVSMHTEFYVSPSDATSLTIEGGRKLPEGEMPDDVIHITTSDMEWFPVRRVLLAPCIKLTKYVQAGRGKYKDIPMLSEKERSEDAPVDDGCPHCKVPIDCCTFDRVLLFIASMLFPGEQDFALDLSEVNALAHAADALGLQPLSDLCSSQVSSFDSRVRRDRYIRLAEVVKRNDEHGELIIILDGMVLDISRWIDEHPGGPSIIPSQALNIDCTVFFEMYHVSRQAFLYLKSFYIGELAPADLTNLRGSADDDAVEASEGFLQSLRSYTGEWRAQISEAEDEKVHKSL